MDMFARIADPRILEVATDAARRIEARVQTAQRDDDVLAAAVEDLRASGFLTIMVPASLGGLGGNVLDACVAQEIVSRPLGSAGLAANMHTQYVGVSLVSGLWGPEMLERFLRGVVEQGWLVNNCQAESEMGSPARGGLPATTATRVDGGWRLNGRKGWTTASHLLTHYAVSATVKASGVPEHVGQFLVPAGSPGLSIEPTWEALAMRESASHDLVLDGVFVPDEDVIRVSDDGAPFTPSQEVAPWHGLTFSATYVGIAHAARDWAVRFAATRKPTNLGTTIGELPAVRAKLGEIESLLLVARRMIFDTARDWVRREAERGEIAAQVALVKYVATNNAVRITDLALRIGGGFGLMEREPVERAFRDVRSGLIHPPLDDVSLADAAQRALSEFAE